MHDKRTWHLRHLLIMLVAIGLLPVALVGTWALNNAIEQQRNAVERSALDLSRALATAVDAELNSTVSTLRTMSYAPLLMDGNTADFYVIAKNAVQVRPSWRAVILTDSAGKIVFTTRLSYGDKNAQIVDRENLERAMHSDEPVVGGVFIGRGKNAAYAVRMPVMRNGKLAYVLSAAVSPDRILDILQQQKDPTGWVFAVFDGAGKRVARSKDHLHTLGGPASPSLAKMLATGRSEGVGKSTTLEGVDSLTAFTRIPAYGWSIAVGIASEGVRANLLRGIGAYLFGILASVLVSVAAAIYMARRIAEGIDKLRDRMVCLVRGSGTLQPLESRIREVNEMGEALVVLSTERNQVEAERMALLATLNTALESARQALLQAEDAARAKDVFLAVLGHELRNPLAPIVAALDLLEIKGDITTSRERGIMRRQVDHMLRLVDDLLDASRIVQGKLEIRQGQVEIREVVHQALESVRGSAQTSGTAIVDTQPEQAIWVAGDITRLVQAVTNLLVNALRFTPAGQIHLMVREQDSWVSILVEDDGAGMTSETVANVFQPFFQAPQSIDRSQGGLGLGLAIVKSIVELHGGRVLASSNGLGKGSCFEIILPMIAQPTMTPVVERETGKPVTSKVMVVDDNADAADMTAAGLSSAGYQVQTVYNARDALEILATFEPVAIILDIGMPDMDGYELARVIRIQHPAWCGRLIALSGYGQDKDKRRALAAGFDLHLTKPVHVVDLVKALSDGASAKKISTTI